MQKFLQSVKIVPLIQPVSITTLQGGNYNFVSCKNANRVGVLIETGVLTSTASAVTLKQAKNVEGASNKALGFSKVWQNIPAASPQEDIDLWQEIDVTSDTFDVASNRNYLIDLDMADFDVANGFDCIRLHVAAPGTSLLISAKVILYNLRYHGEGLRAMPPAGVNTPRDYAH